MLWTSARSTRRGVVILALGLSAIGCDRREEPPASRDPAPSPTPPASAPTSSSKVPPGSPLVRPGLYERRVRVDGLDRSFALHVPKAYNRLRRLPVVIFLHGQDGPLVDDGGPVPPHLAKGLERAHAVGVFPQPAKGVGKWVHELCGAESGQDRPDDVGYLTAVWLEVERSLMVDHNRFFLVGVGTGAVMAQRAAAAFGSRLAGVAAIGGSVGCHEDGGKEPSMLPEPSGPVPVMLVHGRRDQAFPYAGGKPTRAGAAPGFSWLSSDRTLAYWTSANGCESKRKREALPGGDKRESLDCAREPVVRYSLREQGAGWPDFVGKKPLFFYIMETLELRPGRKR